MTTVPLRTFTSLLLLSLTTAGASDWGLRPHLDLSWDDGRENDAYNFDFSNLGTVVYVADGFSVQPGLGFRPPRTPLLLDISFLRGFPPKAAPYYRIDSQVGVYGAVNAGWRLSQDTSRELAVEVSYLNDISRWRHAFWMGRLRWETRARWLTWSALAGAGYEQRRYSTVVLDRPMALATGQVAFSLWFVQPYLGVGLLYKLTTGKYDSGPWLHTSHLTGFVSVGLRMASAPGGISALAHRMTAPKGLKTGGPE